MINMVTNSRAAAVCALPNDSSRGLDSTIRLMCDVSFASKAPRKGHQHHHKCLPSEEHRRKPRSCKLYFTRNDAMYRQHLTAVYEKARHRCVE